MDSMITKRANFRVANRIVAVVFAGLLMGSVIVGCAGNQNPETESQAEVAVTEVSAMPSGLTFEEQVEWYIQYDQYEEAFALVRAADQQLAETRELLVATHMTYALHLTYGSLVDMRTRMPEALRHFRRVVELDPANERAKAEIAQIEGIYRSLNREIPQGIAE
jgi:Flp pilus assembly protein TadD